MSGNSRIGKIMLAYVLYSGGLDSGLAIKLIQEQGIKVVGVHFVSPFFGNPDFCKKISREQNFKLIVKKVDKKYLNIIRKPKYGYGSEMNPCLDCHIYMLKETKKLAKDQIMVTGEVLGQRPKSQKFSDFKIIEKETKLENRILRPLSAKLLQETIYEKKGIIDREKLLGIKGRSRGKQLELAKKYKQVIIPGYTHLQQAQPVLFSHYLLAYFFKRQHTLITAT